MAIATERALRFIPTNNLEAVYSNVMAMSSYLTKGLAQKRIPTKTLEKIWTRARRDLDIVKRHYESDWRDKEIYKRILFEGERIIETADAELDKITLETEQIEDPFDGQYWRKSK